MNKLVLFYDDNCGPSRQAKVAVKSLSSIDVELVHIDSDPIRVRDTKIVAIPTLILQDDSGKELRRFVGYSSENFNKEFKEYK